MAEPGAVRPAPRDRLWLWYLVANVAVVLGYGLVPDGVPRDVVYFAVGASTVVAIVVGIRRHRPAAALPWWLMAVAQSVWVTGDLVYNWAQDVVGGQVHPSPADAFYLLAYPVFTIALVLVVRRRRPRPDVAGALDSLLVTCGLALLSFELIARPALEDTGDTLAAVVVAVAYPLGDLLLMGGLIRLVVTPGSWVRSVRVLLFAVSMLIVADTFNAGFTLYTDRVPWWVDLFWLASYGAWGVAALHPSMVTVTQQTDAVDLSFGRRRLAVLAAAMLVAPGTLVVQQLRGYPPDIWPVAVGSAALFALVVARMYVAIQRIAEVSEQREVLRAELAHEATHDGLTGLANRAYGLVLIEDALTRAGVSGTRAAVLFLDLDGFKAVNDTMGHHAGDLLLREVAERLRSNIRAEDAVIRLGGDEFVAVLQPVTDESTALDVAERLVAAVSPPVAIPRAGTAVVGASIGVALSNAETTAAGDLLLEADAAAYRAKAAGRNRARLFDDALRTELATRSAVEAALESALARDELDLQYQPVVTVNDGRLVGYEALVRWERPGTELATARELLADAESSDLVCAVGRWVLVHACRQLAAWNALGDGPGLTLTVNLSRQHLARTQVVSDVEEALRSTGIRPAQLVVEFAEEVLADRLRSVRHLERIHALGVGVSVDDFGSGYAAVARLRDLPVDTVKIDQRFLDESLLTSRGLLPMVVDAAHSVGLVAVVEGVEDDAGLAALRAARCDLVQGVRAGAVRSGAQVSAELAIRQDGVRESSDHISSAGTGGDHR